MSKKLSAAQKRQKREKKLTKRLMHDFDELLTISVASGSLTQESIVTLLKGINDALLETDAMHDTGKQLRRPGRFLENLHKARKEVIEQGQFAKEDHDIKSLALIQKMAKKGKSEEEISRKMLKLGSRVTPEGIKRILQENP
ncbi:MAG: hypothetical protein ABW148_17120 [Sedimenticola sp.]